MTGRWRRGLKIALAVALVGVALLGLGLAWVRRGPPLPTGEVEVAGLSAPVEVLRDSLGIPHVWASSIEDALFAQGFLHASDRLWQMEQIRRVADGTLAELFGERALTSDRFLRTLGMGRAAERGAEALCAECRVRLGAYVAGVNAALAGWRGPLPPEFVVLRARPEPWTLADVVALEKVMAWDLSEYDIGLTLADVRRRGGDALLERVRPRSDPDGLTILAGGAEGPAVAWLGADAPAPSEALLASARVPALAWSMLDGASAVRASNAWVVGGARSRSGKPLLANDMHLALQVPTLWYLMGLHAPGLDVVGMTLPGSAGVVAGHSRAVAWGFSNASVDDVDFFVERVDPADTTRYLIPGGSEPFVVRTETIRVRGLDEPVLMRVRETRHGPVMSDVEARAGGELLAVRWVAHDPATTPEAVLGMNTARSAAEFVEALRLFRDPHQNVVFADTTGAFGYWMAGRVPLRASGSPPLLPVPGWTGEHDWIGDLPFERHPHALNPASGYVVTANNRQTRDSVSLLITDGSWAPPYRAERISERIQASPLHDAASMLAIQLDLVSGFALKHRGAAAAAFRAAGHSALADSLAFWDGSTAIERREPVLFHSWVEALRVRLARAAYGGEPGYFPTAALDRMLAGGEVGHEVASAAAGEAVERAGALRWGEAHPLVLDHPLGEVRALASSLGFARRSVPMGGDPFTVNVASHNGREPPFVVTHGASQRHVVDLGDLEAGGFVLPGGQSGLPRSPHAFDQLPLWLQGRLAPLPLARTAVEARTVTRLRLTRER